MQPAGTVPPKELDAIADSLVTIALGGPSGATGAETRHSAASALRAAALGLGARASEVPYRGGLDRLSRIAIDGKDEMVRIVAMLGLSRLPDSARVVSVFRALAMKQDVLAVDAVDLLWKSMGPAGLQALRELDRDALVTEPEARRELSFIARKFGWR